MRWGKKGQLINETSASACSFCFVFALTVSVISASFNYHVQDLLGLGFSSSVIHSIQDCSFTLQYVCVIHFYKNYYWFDKDFQEKINSFFNYTECNKKD